MKQTKRTIRVTQEMIDETKQLLQVMGIPIVQDKSEAEAQCEMLNKQGVAVGVASEDLDSLAYGANTLLRKFKNTKKPVIQIELEEILKSFSITQNQFIDLCVLCGSDYTQPIKGIGPANALKLIQKYGSLEIALGEIKTTTTKSTNELKFKIPNDYKYKEAASIFKNPEVYDKESLNVLFHITLD